MRGPGETQIETDRRIIGQKISLLKSSLASLVERMELVNGVSMAIMENTDAESQNYKKVENESKKLSDDVKKATKDVDALIDEVEKEINEREDKKDRAGRINKRMSLQVHLLCKCLF